MIQQNPGSQDTQIPLPKKKKKRGCCSGCLMIILVFVILLIGTIGYFWYQSIPKKSAVEKEYNQVPDYFQN